eukprot:gene4328-4581_t
MEVFNALRRNIRLLENLTIFCENGTELPGLVPGTADHAFAAVLKLLQAGDLAAAQNEYRQLASILKLSEDDINLEPLRTLLHLKLWEGSTADRAKVQQYLAKRLCFKYEEEQPNVLQENPPPAAPTQPSPAGQDTSGPQPTSAPDPNEAGGAPTQLTHDSYSPDVFRQHVAQTCSAGGYLLSDLSEPSMLLQLLQDTSVPWGQRLSMLTEEQLPAAAVPVAILVELLRAAQGEDHHSAIVMDSTVETWVLQSWHKFTKQQAVAVRAALLGPPLGQNPEVDRTYVAAMVAKALAASPTHSDNLSEGLGAAWGPGAAEAAAAAALQRVLVVCEEIGSAADWVRVQVLYAQLHLQRKQHLLVDMTLFVTFMKMLSRCNWTLAPRSRGEWAHHLLGVGCAVCGCHPIVGRHFRSWTQYKFTVCEKCVGSPAAQAASPLEEVLVDDSIYMLPVPPLPEVITPLLSSESAALEEARKMLLDLVIADGGTGGSSETFTAHGLCPLAAAGVLLPADWRDLVVAEGKLLSGRGNAADWARLYQQHHGNVALLRDRAELEFSAHNRSSYGTSEEVVLHLTTKNAGPQGVLVKVYEINIWNYYIAEGVEVDLDLELAGVAATKTFPLKTPDDPMLRTQHSLSLGLAGCAGVWLVEAVSGGTRARARIHKGCLHLSQRPSVAGQILTVLDEHWRPVEAVKIWCQGKEYTSKLLNDGHTAKLKGSDCNKGAREVVLPYSRSAQMTPLVIWAAVSVDAGATTSPSSARLQQVAVDVNPAGTPAAQGCVMIIKDFE